jgi:hypothetical protein
MADTSNDKKIVVDSFTGGNDGDDLINCYFKVKNDDTYDFHDKDDHTKCTGMTVGSSCSFSLDEDPGITWTITLTAPCTETEVNGSWTAQSDEFEAEQEGGTFQAQAGGGADDEVEEEDKAVGPEIHIHHIHSDHGTDYGDELKHCYFRLDDNGEYKLYDPDDGELQKGITSNEVFFFKYKSQEWEMTADLDSLKNKGHGSWKLLSGISDEIDGGTFQAQAGGGGGVEENVYSANA